jgi:hypothetical protein
MAERENGFKPSHKDFFKKKWPLSSVEWSLLAIFLMVSWPLGELGLAVLAGQCT